MYVTNTPTQSQFDGIITGYERLKYVIVSLNLLEELDKESINDIFRYSDLCWFHFAEGTRSIIGIRIVMYDPEKYPQNLTLYNYLKDSKITRLIKLSKDNNPYYIVIF